MSCVFDFEIFQKVAELRNPPFSYRWKITDALGDDVRFIKASEHFEKGKRQNRLSELAK